eukprot:5476509-Prymnesium_polylepis.1
MPRHHVAHLVAPRASPRPPQGVRGDTDAQLGRAHDLRGQARRLLDGCPRSLCVERRRAHLCTRLGHRARVGAGDDDARRHPARRARHHGLPAHTP